VRGGGGAGPPAPWGRAAQFRHHRHPADRGAPDTTL